MKLRDREDRGFPSPLLLSYTSSSPFLSPPPCRRWCRWQGDADTSQSLPQSDEHLLPLSRFTFLLHICFSSPPVLFLTNISFCHSSFVSVDSTFFPFSLGGILSYLGVFLSLPLIFFPSLKLIYISVRVRLTDWEAEIYCHDVGKSYDNSPQDADFLITTNKKEPLCRWNIG